jgi:predicted transcriptional regulator
VVRRRIIGLPVVDIKDDLVGIITKTDIQKTIFNMPKQIFDF